MTLFTKSLNCLSSIGLTFDDVSTTNARSTCDGMLQPVDTRECFVLRFENNVLEFFQFFQHVTYSFLDQTTQGALFDNYSIILLIVL